MASYEVKHSAKTGILATIALVLLVGALVLLDIRTANKDSSIGQNTESSTDDEGQSSSVYNFVETEVAGQKLKIPEGFVLVEYAREIESARFMTFDQSGTLFVGTKENDKVYAIQDLDGDGFAETTNIVAEGLRVPHSVHYYDGDLYVAQEDKVTVYREISPDGSYSSAEDIIEGLPFGEGHKTRTLIIGDDGKIYLSIGSVCNVCEETDPKRATIMRYNLDGSSEEVFATGLRNSVGLDFDDQGRFWAADMGRDRIGDDIPPEEINIIQEGHNYGWPYCYGFGITNPEYPDQEEFCMNETHNPSFEMQAHSAPLGLLAMKDSISPNWPIEFQRSLLVAFHGSWNRTVPTGYKVVWVDIRSPNWTQHDLVSGWLDEDSGEAWGRPAGLVFDSSGNLYISDDKTGSIYKLSYGG